MLGSQGTKGVGEGGGLFSYQITGNKKTFLPGSGDTQLSFSAPRRLRQEEQRGETSLHNKTSFQNTCNQTTFQKGNTNTAHFQKES